MASKINKGLKRTALSVALGMCFASSLVLAQSSVGSIFGSAKSGATVTIENTATGQSREITADGNGRFNFGQLAPGSYKVTADGSSREVSVRVGTGSQVDFTGAVSNVDTIEVVGGGSINPIDVSSVESTTVFTAEQLRRIPVGRDVTSVALLAPGTTRGSGANFNGLASFGGSSVAENGYYINGFDVTNIYKFTSFASLPYEAIGEQQIKTGGYGAEFGRSLGGVVNIVTKRGTNDWHFGASAYLSPEGFRERGRDVVSRNQEPDDNNDGIDNGPGDTTINYAAYRSANTSSSLIYNFYGSGPIVEDRLFFFGLVEGRRTESDAYGIDTSANNVNLQPRGIVKLDWNISDNHNLELTAISDRTNTRTINYDNTHVAYDGDPLYDTIKYTGQHGDYLSDFKTLTGGETYILKYTGYLTDDFTLSILGGQLKSLQGKQTPSLLPGFDCPAAIDARNPTNTGTYIGCWDPSQFTLTDPSMGPDRDKRASYRIDAEWRLGDHLVRFGLDHEKFTSTHGGQGYSGGEYYRYRIVGSTGKINGVGGFTPGQEYVRYRQFISGTGAYEITNAAYYVEDSWQFSDNLMLYGGLRGESFDNKNAIGQSFVASDLLLAPRMGFAWDVNGDGSLKVFGNAGRYYIPVASNTNIRAAAPEGLIEQYYLFTGIDSVTGAPTALNGPQIGATLTNGITQIPDPSRVASSTLSPMYQDEFILGAQRDMGNNWTVGARAIYRKVGSGFDDFCAAYPMIDWAEDNGYDNFDPYGDPQRPQCVLINPGEDNTIGLNLEGDGVITQVTIPADYWQLPKYKRSYKALEIFFEKSSAKWSLQGSYTWSQSYGNIEGYVDSSSLQQTDSGLTQNFDHGIFERGADGYLQNDRTHSLKLFGSYNFNDEWRVGGSLLVQSGSPISCRSFIDLDDPSLNQEDIDNLLGFYAGSAFTCRSPDESNAPSTRGGLGRTPWTFNLDSSLAYQPKWAEGLTMQMDVFNILNNQTVITKTERSALGSAATNSYNPDFLNDESYQAVRSVRFSVRYDFN